jgi:hypothetical protein
MPLGEGSANDDQMLDATHANVDIGNPMKQKKVYPVQE